MRRIRPSGNQAERLPTCRTSSRSSTRRASLIPKTIPAHGMQQRMSHVEAGTIIQEEDGQRVNLTTLLVGS